MSDDRLYVGIDYGSRRVAMAIIQRRTRSIVLLEDLVLSESSRDLELLALGSFVADKLEPLAGLVGMVSIEGAILGRSLNANTLANLGYTAGALMYACSEVGCRARVVASASWKKVALGNGNASKDDVMRWARLTYRTAAIATQDQADAIGLATHAMRTES